MAFDDGYSYLACEDGQLLLTEDDKRIILSDKTQITEPTDAYRTAQEAKIRRVQGRVLITSHYKQYGEVVSGQLKVGSSLGWVVGQRFRSPSSFTLTDVEFLMSGFEDNTGNLEIFLYDETADEMIASGVASGPRDRTMRWRRIPLNATVNLTGGNFYIVAVYASNSDSYFVATADYTGEEWSLRAVDLDDPDVLLDKQVLTRIIASQESLNEREIAELQGFRLIRSRKQGAYQFEAEVANIDNKYSVGQAYGSYFEAGKTIKAYIGFDIDGLMVYCRAFLGDTEDCPTGSSTATLKAKCYFGRLLNQTTSSEVLGGQAYEDMIEAIAERCGISSFNLRETGKTSTAGIRYQGLLASSIVDSIRQATLDVLQFKNGSTMITESRAKPTVSPSDTPKYEISSDNFILYNNISVNYDTSDMINRVTVTNDEDGETSSDGNTLDVGAYQTVGTASGSLLATEETKQITITLTEYACIYLQWSDADSDTTIRELSRTCGGHNSYGSVVLELTNKNYPDDSADYDITVKGCPISNADSGTVLAEAVNQVSIDTYGLASERIDNKIFANLTDAQDFADGVIDEVGLPKEMIIARCRGIADIYPNDVVAVVENKAGLSHMAIADTVEIEYRTYPAQFTMSLQAEKTPHKMISGCLLTEDGECLLTEDDEKILL